MVRNIYLKLADEFSLIRGAVQIKEGLVHISDLCQLNALIDECEILIETGNEAVLINDTQ